MRCFLKNPNCLSPKTVHGAIFGVSLIALATLAPQAASRKSFLVGAKEGYGVTECYLASGDSCGKAISNAYCESKGLGTAVAFGPADDVTGAITTTNARSAPPNALIVTCDK